MSDEKFTNSPWFQALPKYYQDVILKMKNPTADSPQTATLQTFELPKSPWMSRNKKDPQGPDPVRRSPRHMQSRKFTMEEKAKTVIIESEEEDEGPPTYVEEVLP